jgi:hypothetical protein
MEAVTHWAGNAAREAVKIAGVLLRYFGSILLSCLIVGGAYCGWWSWGWASILATLHCCWALYRIGYVHGQRSRPAPTAAGLDLTPPQLARPERQHAEHEGRDTKQSEPASTFGNVQHEVAEEDNENGQHEAD